MPPREPIDLYAGLDVSDSLKVLAQRGTLVRKRRGAQLITEGEYGDTLYIVLSGRLRAYSEGPDGREITYGEYGPGEYVGEMSLDGGPRAANVEAVEATLCAMVTRHTLKLHLDEDPAFAFELLAKVIRRARAATLGLRQVALNSVYGRLKDELERITVLQDDGTRLADPAPSQLAMSRKLGCSREMVTRLTQELVKGGYVEQSRRCVRLLKKLPAKF
jgi:CRP/FNR family transcriptional regulator, cyclic AMP receptor protein